MSVVRYKLLEEIQEALVSKGFSNYIKASAGDYSFTKNDEAFFAELLNLILDYNLVKTETLKKDYPAIDLFDKESKVIAQVTYSIDNKKLEDSMTHKIIENYKGYKFFYIYIGTESEKFKNFKRSKKELSNPFNLVFSREENLIDSGDLYNKISNITDTKKLQKIRDLFDYEKNLNSQKISTHLSKVVNILKSTKNNLNKDIFDYEKINEFNIQEKINYNNLIHYDRKVREYSKFRNLLQGTNGVYKISAQESRITAREVYNKIETYYIRAMTELNPGKKIAVDGDKVFINVFDNAKKDIKNSREYENIEDETLEDCIYIILVDAFLECKWFERPPKKEENL